MTIESAIIVAPKTNLPKPQILVKNYGGIITADFEKVACSPRCCHQINAVLQQYAPDTLSPHLWRDSQQHQLCFIDHCPDQGETNWVGCTRNQKLCARHRKNTGALRCCPRFAELGIESTGHDGHRIGKAVEAVTSNGRHAVAMGFASAPRP